VRPAAASDKTLPGPTDRHLHDAGAIALSLSGFTTMNTRATWRVSSAVAIVNTARSRDLAAAVRVRHCVGREQLEQRLHVAAAARDEEPLGELRGGPAIGREARAGRRNDVLFGTLHELSRIGLRRLQHARHLGPLESEHLRRDRGAPCDRGGG
jgi:hypothetical protein